MDITQKIQELKTRPDFVDNVGMILVHNGVVRGWSRNGKANVEALEVSPDHEKIAALREEYLRHDGIYEIIVEAQQGILRPGDDLLYIVVAGDIREHVKPVLADLLERIKSEAVVKTEIVAQTDAHRIQ